MTIKASPGGLAINCSAGLAIIVTANQDTKKGQTVVSFVFTSEGQVRMQRIKKIKISLSIRWITEKGEGVINVSCEVDKLTIALEKRLQISKVISRYPKKMLARKCCQVNLPC